MTFKGWQKTSLIEYPGKISTVVFTGGCNFRCPFCYNAELVERAETVADLPAETVLAHLRAKRRLYQAVVVSGGEPTLHGGLASFLSQVKSLGLSAGLETNGSHPAVVGKLLTEGLVDFLAMDVKAPLEARAYRRAAGLESGAERIVAGVRRTLELLRAADIDVELRLTVVPTIHTPEEIVKLAAQLDGFPTFVLQQFQPENALEPRLRSLRPVAEQVLRDLHGQVRGRFSRCEVRGL